MTANQLKGDRQITPNLMVIRCGSSEEPYFDMLLIEEQSKFGMSYSQFLEVIQVEVSKLSNSSIQHQ